MDVYNDHQLAQHGTHWGWWWWWWWWWKRGTLDMKESVKCVVQNVATRINK